MTASQGYKLCITEKPSVARDIANILGAKNRGNGFFEGNGYRVTWTYGHLCTLKEPADYTEVWKRWTLSVLPMVPDRFSIKVIEQESIKNQMKIIEGLAADAQCIINCGDAGQEGELIQRWVMQKARVKCPVYRLWISSLTDDAIRDGFRNLKPDSDYVNLYHAGLSRAIGDWLLGMNATRLYTIKYSRTRGNILSVGRVQTPTLALVVARKRAISNFVPEPFWELRTKYRDVIFNAARGRFDSEEKAREALNKITGTEFKIKDVSSKKGKETPPRLFDLTSLQVECNKKLGWSADHTLQLIQSLYEKKVTTYPRVDTTYLLEDQYPKIPGILRSMTPYASVTAPVLATKIPKSKKVFDNSKITDHHAIIPTGEHPGKLVGDEKMLYHIIALRFIGAFYPDCIFETTTVKGFAEDVEFTAKGKVIVNPGWRALFPAKANKQSEDNSKKDSAEDTAEDEEGVLPEFKPGESGPHEPLLTQKMTQPPSLFTEGTLLRAMETAGKTVDDEDLREALKANGIGRPSTRANIIETLFKRGYITRKRKSIDATEAGCQLIDIISDPLVKSAKLTGIWENKLRQIELGTYQAADFISELKKMVYEIVDNVKKDTSGRTIETETIKTNTPPKAKKTKK